MTLPMTAGRENEDVVVVVGWRKNEGAITAETGF
jgi:hypothetical protein